MKFRVAVLLAALLSLPVQPAGAAKPLVSALIMQKTTRVHNCEEPVWNINGPKYYGGLGWLDATWLAFRSPGDPRYMSQASPQRQARAMSRFAAKYNWPDQFGCQGSY